MKESGRQPTTNPLERDNPVVICRMPSGWAQLADRQYLRGYCILMAEPQVISLNALDAAARERFLLDMSLIGDALLEVSGAYRINYAIAGNNCPLLHAHIVPRYQTEPDDMLHNHPWAYPPEVMASRPLDPDRDAPLIKALAQAILSKLK
jgi:diadenosine tetraphosphate (Ap4A) HIT family hydrolase